MSIPPGHCAELEHIFAIPGFLQGPALTFGVVDVVGDTPGAPTAFPHADLGSILASLGAGPVETMDLFDPRADWRADMNLPLPAGLKGRFRTVVDLGSLEHVFDTRQCLENLFQMLQIGGHLALQTPCKGFYDHGFHTFSPEAILVCLASNGFAFRHLSLTTPSGQRLTDPADAEDVLLWVVGRKDQEQPFVIPQQKRFWFIYGLSQRPTVR